MHATSSTQWPLEQLVVLKPAWLANLMKTVVTAQGSKLVEDRSRLTSEQLRVLWTADATVQYATELHPTLVRLLEGFDVMYKVKGAGHRSGHARVPNFVVPAMLPECTWSRDDVPPLAGDDATVAASIRIKLDHVPLHFFPRLHARIQMLICPETDNLWRTAGRFNERDGAHSVVLWQPRSLPGTVEVRRRHHSAQRLFAVC